MTTLRKYRRSTIAACRGIDLQEPIHRQDRATSVSADYQAFKVQLKRAVDSVDVPEYLIDAIKAAIRR